MQCRTGLVLHHTNSLTNSNNHRLQKQPNNSHSICLWQQQNMAMVMDQQQQTQSYKHYCRICKKGFGCGRALGGHMRAHGINYDSAGNSNGDQDADDASGCSDWGAPADERLDPSPPSNKRMYSLRANPNRLKSCRVCENCSKEFVSWKSFLEHGKCSSDDDADDSFVSSPMSDGDDDDLVGGWSKGKRSRRAKSVVAATPLSAICPSSEEEDLANCLMLLSSARVDPMFVDEGEESCASASKEEDHRRHYPIPDIEKCKAPVLLQAVPPPTPVPKGMFECKACKKAFTSHQALGGHRASHKKVKGCFAAKLDVAVDPYIDAALLPNEEEIIIIPNDNTESAAVVMSTVPFNNAPLAATPLKKKLKVHECSICRRQFASGQALGGHKRCHWITSNSGADPNPTAELQRQQQDPISNRRANQQHQRYELTLRPMFDASETLDLNTPASAEGGGVRQQDTRSPLSLDVPPALCLQPWGDHKNKATTTTSSNNKNITTNNNNNNNNNIVDMNDEVDSKVKLAKLSELKDMNVGGDQGSPWLQMGIGSSGRGSRESMRY